jgi:UDP-N-acetylglucosamine 2-epimerase (non-hydrolysing)
MGTRPEVIKLGPVVASLRSVGGIRCRVIATGQHGELLPPVADQLGVGVDVDLDVMQPNQSLAALTARLLEAIDRCLEQEHPDLVVVQGDPTTMFVAALAAFYRRVPVAHVEAGLRTRDFSAPFPEEANRRLASRLVALHFAPTETARAALVAEGIDASAITVTGNTSIDAILAETKRQEDAACFREADRTLRAAIGDDWATVPTVLLTAHRRENIGEGIERICRAVAELAARFADHRFVCPVHPNPNVDSAVRERLSGIENVRLTEPLDYRAFVALMARCRIILTDSGGIQEEAPTLGKPVLVLRETTERPEGVQAGTAVLCGVDVEKIVETASLLLTEAARYDAMAAATNPYGDGRAAERIAQSIRDYLRSGPDGTVPKS